MPYEPTDFSRLILRENANFVGRDWALREIAGWIESQERRSRYFLITGKPGSGKTALSARLASLSSQHGADGKPLAGNFLSATHFCSERETLWNSPIWFARSLAKQLAARYPDYANCIDLVSRKELNICIEQTVTNGHATGIGSLTLNFGQLSANELFSQICRVPLGQLANLHPDHRFIILIDGIDESMSYDTSTTIVSLVANLSELPENVLFIVTSRDKTKVELLLDGPSLDLSSTTHADNSRADIASYIEQSLSSTTSPNEIPPALKREFVDQGNFLFAHLAIRMFLTTGAGDFPTVLPDGLPALMSEWLHRILSSTGRDWVADYAPVFGALCVAQESLSETQLKVFCGQSGTRVRNNLNDLREFLNVDYGAIAGYSLYHNSLRQFLFVDTIEVNASVLPNMFRLEKAEEHERIVRAYQVPTIDAKEPAWSNLDDYGYRHLSAHLGGLANLPKYSEAIFHFVSGRLLAEKRRRFGGDASFVDDVMQAIRAARTQKPVNYREWIRGTVILGCLQQPFQHLPPLAVATLAIGGEIPLARSIANLRANGFDCLLVAEAFAAGGHKELAREFLDLAIDFGRKIEVGTLPHRRLLDLVHAVGAPDQWRGVFRQIASANRFLGTIPPEVFQELADFCARIDDLTEVEQTIASISSDPMFHGAGDTGFLGFMASKFQAICVAQVAEASRRAGRSQYALDLVDQCLAIEASTGSTIDELRVIAGLILSRLGKPLRARRLVERLQPKFRAEFRARLRAESGTPKSAFEEARKSRDDDTFGMAVSLALGQEMFELAMREAKGWKGGVARDRAFSRIAIATARKNLWDDAGRALEEIEITTDEEMWHVIARALGDAPAADVGEIANTLDAAAVRIGPTPVSAQIQAVCAFGVAHHGSLRPAVSRVMKLIKETQERFGKQRVYDTLANIAVLLDENGCSEGRRIAEQLMKASQLPGGEWARSYLGDTVEETFARMKIQLQEDPELAEAIRAGTGQINKLFEDATAGLSQFADDESDTDIEPDESVPLRIPVDVFLKRLQDETNRLKRHEILEYGAADAVLALGSHTVLDAAFRAAPGLVLHSVLSKIAGQLVDRGEFDAALGFMAAHLEQPGILLESSRFFGQLDDYVPLIWKAGGTSLLCRVAESLMEFAAFQAAESTTGSA